MPTVPAASMRPQKVWENKSQRRIAARATVAERGVWVVAPQRPACTSQEGGPRAARCGHTLAWRPQSRYPERGKGRGPKPMRARWRGKASLDIPSAQCLFGTQRDTKRPCAAGRKAASVCNGRARPPAIPQSSAGMLALQGAVKAHARRGNQVQKVAVSLAGEGLYKTPQ